MNIFPPLSQYTTGARKYKIKYKLKSPKNKERDPFHSFTRVVKQRELPDAFRPLPETTEEWGVGVGVGKGKGGGGGMRGRKKGRKREWGD